MVSTMLCIKDSITDLEVLYSGKLSREKTLPNFEVLWLFAKVFFTKFGHVAFFCDTIEQSLKVFL